MPELERALVELGRSVEFPPEPDLAPSVRLRLVEPARPRIRRRGLAIALAVLAVAVGAVLAVPPARTAVLEWLGIKGVTVVRVDELPPTPRTGDLNLGRRVTLAEARRRAPWLLVPRDTPDGVYLSERVPGGQVAFVWGTPSSVRLLVTEFRGEAIAEKMLGPGTRAEAIRIDGSRGVWFDGAPHAFVYRGFYDGEPREETLRLAENALVWQRGQLTVRVEGKLSKEDAIRIARSAR